ncbi:hypothetical protein [uncultured Leptotrichia sp.]|uniref:hypothetical protein n=1 Tax=uncultured Leptotrichia sp. TaxID=159271 RepID=UPI0025E329F1|nr:hypothetical protein [uncultured Leptotrichia sp.]
MGLELYIEKIARKELAYFRKVNFLIPFFENYFNVKLENLENLELTKESIEELRDRCKRVLNDRTLVKDLLPTQGGFFFGNINYDEYYYDDVVDVLENCNALLPEFDNLKEDESIIFKIWF